jgi:hypothetical protein
MIRHREDQTHRLLRIQVPLHHPALEHLADGIRGDETEAPQRRLPSRQELRRPVPPVHHEIGALVHVRVRRPQSLRIAGREARAQVLAADEGRLPHDELRLRPVRPPRVRVALDPRPSFIAVVGAG